MHRIILSLWDVHFFSDITVGIRYFFEELDQTHEPLTRYFWVGRSRLLMPHKQFQRMMICQSCDGDGQARLALGSTACPRRSHQQQFPAPPWKTIWCRLGARCTVATDQRSPNLGIFLVMPIGDAGTVARAGRTMERWSRLTCHTIFDHPHVSLIEPPQSRGTTRGLLRCRRTSHAPKQRSSPVLNKLHHSRWKLSEVSNAKVKEAVSQSERSVRRDA